LLLAGTQVARKSWITALVNVIWDSIDAIVNKRELIRVHSQLFPIKIANHSQSS